MSMEGAAGAFVDPGAAEAGPRANYDPDTITGAVALLYDRGFDPFTRRPGSARVFNALGRVETNAGKAADSIGRAIGLAREGDAVLPEEFVEEPELEPAAKPDTPGVVFGKWVISSQRGRTERARDSVDSHRDREFEKGVAIAAARAQVRRVRKQGLPRPKRPAADGYLPGQKPRRTDRWNSATRQAVLAYETAETVTAGTEWLVQSQLLQDALEARNAERAAEATAPVFEAYPVIPAAEAERLWRAERDAFEAGGRTEPRPAVAAISEELPQPDPDAVRREELAFRGLRKGLRRRLQEFGGRTPRRVIPEFA